MPKAEVLTPEINPIVVDDKFLIYEGSIVGYKTSTGVTSLTTTYCLNVEHNDVTYKVPRAKDTTAAEEASWDSLEVIEVDDNTDYTENP